VTTRLPRRRDDAVVREDGTATWLVAPGTGDAHILNPTARAIWELCDGATTVEELVDAIRQVFDVTPATARADVEAVIHRLESAELVSWSGVEPRESGPRD
jgi:hypothetical protein